MKYIICKLDKFKIPINMNIITKTSLLFLLLMTSCKFVKNETISIEEVVGIARNQKYGAVLYSDDNKVYGISGLQNWDSIYLDKEVKLKGTFKFRIGDDKVEIKNLGTFQAQNYSKYYLVENASWKLFLEPK